MTVTWQPKATIKPCDTVSGHRSWAVFAGGGPLGFVSEGRTHDEMFYTTGMSVTGDWRHYPTREAAVQAVVERAVTHAAATPRYPDADERARAGVMAAGDARTNAVQLADNQTRRRCAVNTHAGADRPSGTSGRTTT